MNPIPDPLADHSNATAEQLRPTILLVDDDVEIRAAFRATLCDSFEILEAGSGTEALHVISEHIPDLVISDISMPGLDGVSLLREIRTRDLDIPVILVTGEPELDGAVKAVEYGAFRYLTKPVDVARVMQLVDEAVGMRRMAEAKRKMSFLSGGRRGTPSDRAGQEARFERALESIRLHFQPIWSRSARAAVGYECLLRCNEPSLSSPPDLIAAADDLGRSHEVGRAIRGRALEQLPFLPEGASLFVNLHYTDLEDEELFDPNSAFAHASDRLVLEITERESLEAIAHAQDKVAHLRALGFRIAMDDLGAGHNGLAAFAQLAPEIVKLDMKLIRHIDRVEEQCSLVQVMLDYCQSRDMLVIAEGVETEEELATLAGIGTDLFQGYYIAQPQGEIIEPADPFPDDDEGPESV